MNYKCFLLGMFITLPFLQSCMTESLLKEGEPASICISTRGTKVSGDIASSESTVNSIQAFAFRPDGTLDGQGASSSLSVTFDCTTGERDILVLANTSNSISGASLGEVTSKSFLLADEELDKFRMSQSTRTYIRNTSNRLSMKLERYISKVGISKIKYNMKDNSLALLPFTLKNVYLTNVRGDMSIAGVPGELWHNKLVYSNDIPSLTNNEINQPLATGSQHTTPYHLYMYPNPTKEDSHDKTTWSQRHSRVVFEGLSGTQLYYYPVTLPIVKRNTAYRFQEVHIARAGTLHPEDPLSYVALTFNDPVVEDMGSAEGVLELQSSLCDLLFLPDGVDPFEYINSEITLGNNQYTMIFSDGTVSPFETIEQDLGLGTVNGIIVFKDGSVLAFETFPQDLDLTTISKVIVFSDELEDFLKEQTDLNITTTQGIIYLAPGSIEAYRQTLTDMILSNNHSELMIVPASEVQSFVNLTKELNLSHKENILVIHQDGLQTWESVIKDITVS